MPIFDACVFVDWSARNGLSPRRPSPSAVWVGELDSPRGPRTGSRATCWRTRHEAVQYVERRLCLAVAEGLKVLVGFDFPCGYPSGYAAALASNGTSAPWRYVWDTFASGHVDGPDNLNNRFRLADALNARCRRADAGPFWCCPPSASSRRLAAKRQGVRFPFVTDAGTTLAGYKRCDLRVLERGRRNGARWLATIPGVCIFLVVMAGNYLGDWLRDRFDPRLRQLH